MANRRLKSAKRRHNLPSKLCKGIRTLSQTAIEVARRLIRRSQQERTDNIPSARGAADACRHLYEELSRWVGPEGCHALFARALTEARHDHPALKQLELRPRTDSYVHGVDEAILEHGDPAIEAALESVLAVLVDLLFRLIGNDMAMKLIKRSLTPADRAAQTRDRKREEA